MKFIVKLFPEITIKSRSVRQRFAKRLASNLKIQLLRLDSRLWIKPHWDFIEIIAEQADPALGEAIKDVLGRTPGIASYSEVSEIPFTTFDALLEPLVEINAARLAGKTFAVRVKRVGDHDFTSIDMERYLGGGLRARTQAAGIDLSKPDEVVQVELRHSRAFIVTDRRQGLGGFPLGTQDDVLSLISGGFDSTVATYQTMRRGCKTHFCFFNLGGLAHEVGVRQVSHHIWQRYGSAAKVKFISIPFEEVVGDILENVHHSMMGVVLKRVMLRAANKVAWRLGAGALVTGESIAQVSSQTLTNLNVIDEASEVLVLRPLIVTDKQDIINQAKQIGTYDYAASMPEYCGVISDRPTVNASLAKVKEEEAKLSEEVFNRALDRATVRKIDRILEDLPNLDELEAPVCQVVRAQQDVVIDIRHPDEQEQQPLDLPGQTVLHIPFYKLNAAFAELQQNRQYLLYCEQGVMSKLHAVHLRDAGFDNVGVYQP